MLALTECRAGGPHVAAAAVNEPIVDWIFPEGNASVNGQDRVLEDQTSKRNSGSKTVRATPSFLKYARNGLLDAATLLECRDSMFRRPADYFDPFASPVLYFRSPGIETPRAAPLTVLDEFAELSLFERDDFHRQQLKLSALSDATLAREEPDVDGASKKTRKMLKRWPSTGSGLKIPEMKVFTGSTSPLLNQATEMVELLRRSVITQHKKAVPEDNDGWDADEASVFAEERAVLSQSERFQLWNAGHLAGVETAGRYLREVLG
ncbi:hypothetical protein MBLNU459_g5849t1 [Dothideomycetes sp. NU459]